MTRPFYAEALAAGERLEREITEDLAEIYGVRAAWGSGFGLPETVMQARPGGTWQSGQG